MSDRIETYLSNIDWEEKIISEGVEQNSKKWLLNDIANYLKHEYDIPSSPPNNMSSRKTKELMDGIQLENSDLRNHPPVVSDKSERERKLKFKKVVKDAQEKGYIQNFQLSEPWHPKLFLEGELNTFPYQHNSMIAFGGVSRDHFYLGGDNPEGKGRNAKKRHSDSVLNLGHWNPGNSFNEDNEDAVWITYKRTAEAYASRKTDGKRGVLLKMQVPTKWVQCGAHDVREVHGLKEIQNEFGSPQNYRKHIKNNSDEKVAWLIRPRMPLHFIRKVWDLEIFNRYDQENTSIFRRSKIKAADPKYGLPLQSKNQIDAIDLMHVFQKQKMPDKPNWRCRRPQRSQKNCRNKATRLRECKVERDFSRSYRQYPGLEDGYQKRKV